MTEALTSKYRPKTFAEVVGHEAQVRSLQGALKKRSSTAFLFTGASGLGKTTLARIAARELGCQKLDMIEIDGATHTGIEAMREITRDLEYKPLSGSGVKAIIVDEFHALSKAAVQSLLKVLEEPPSHVYWFLCTTEPTKVIKTVQTRCVIVDLKPVPKDVLVGLLEEIAEKEKLFDGPNGDKVLALCAAEAQGSPRQAIANLATCSEAKTVTEAAELLSSAAESAEAIDLAKALFRGANWMEISGLLAKLKEAEVNPESARHVIRAYATSVILGAKNEQNAGRGLEILDCFSQPFNSFDGISPLVLSCGKAVLE